MLSSVTDEQLARLRLRISQARATQKVLTVADDEARFWEGFEGAFREFAGAVPRGRAARLAIPPVGEIMATSAQEAVAGRVLGRIFSQIGGSTNTAQQTASRIRQLLETRWNQAIAELRGSMDTAARQAYDAMLSAEGRQSAGEIIRKILFDPIRKAAVTRIKNDPELVRLLETEAGIFVGAGGGPSLYLKALNQENRLIKIGLDFDHAETALANAVRAAVDTRDYRQLMSIIDPANLQLLTARETRNVIETLRRYAEMWPIAP